MLGGIDIDEEDDSIDDGVGEICNMIAGGWKNRIPELSSRCSLSPPTVISGRDYKIHTVKPSVTVERLYRFDVHTIQVILDYEQRSADSDDPFFNPLSRSSDMLDALDRLTSHS